MVDELKVKESRDKTQTLANQSWNKAERKLRAAT